MFRRCLYIYISYYLHNVQDNIFKERIDYTPFKEPLSFKTQVLESVLIYSFIVAHPTLRILLYGSLRPQILKKS